MTATANGKDVLNLVITEPRVGIWSAELDVDSAEPLTGRVALLVDGVTWVGTAMRGDVASERAHARVVGGAGRLGLVLPARFYVSVTFGTVLADLMKETGEKLAATTDNAVLIKRVDRWTRSYATAGQSLRQLADDAGVVWRVLRDGTIWLGKETWPAAVVEHEQTDSQPGRGSITIAPEAPTLAPGTTFQSKQVSVVHTRVHAEGSRQEALFEDGAGSALGRGMGEFAAIVESCVGNRIDYSRRYPAKVLGQAGDGSLELLADHPKVRGNGITRVPIRHGLPGVRVKVNVGSYVELFFEEGDPKRPAAGLWPDGSSCSEISIVAPTVKITGNLEVTGEVIARSATAPVALSTHLHPHAMGPTSAPTPQP